MRPSLIDPRYSPQSEQRVPGQLPPFTITSHNAPYSKPNSGPSYPSLSQAVPVPLRHNWLVPSEGWLALILLAIALYCVVYSIMVANWVHQSSLLLWSPAAGLLTGLLIAKISRFPQAILHLVACLAGLLLATWLTSIVAFRVPWHQLFTGLLATLSGQPSNAVQPGGDIVFFFYLTFLCFFLGYFGSWLIYRAHLPWLVALVYCSILLVNLNYIQRDLSYLVIIMAGSLVLLVARIQLVSRIVLWKAEGLHTDRQWVRAMNWRCMQAACLIMVLVLCFSWLFPIQNQSTGGKAIWDRLGNVWMNMANGHISLQNLGLLTLPYQPTINFFSNELTISNNVQLPNGQVLYYKSSDAQSHYLESFTYDHFDGHTWTTSLGNGTPYGANSVISTDTESVSSNFITTTVTVLQPPEGSKNYLFAPALPTRFNVANVVYSDGTSGAWTQPDPLTKNEVYVVTSALPQTSPQVLSSISLPFYNLAQWSSDFNYGQLKAAYLQLPSDLSPSVQATVNHWTQGATNAYDALKLLESHFNNSAQFHYSLQNPPIPDKMDVVDWLLQSHTGYCTHYATAMTVMARMLGIPTRVVSGFSHGHFVQTRQQWVVDGSDAHSWVQAYFPGSGWISFDPTPGFSGANGQTSQTTAAPTPTSSAAHTSTKPVSPTKAVPTPQSAGHPAPNAQSNTLGHSNSTDSQPALFLLACGTLILALLFLLYACAAYWWRRLYSRSSMVASMFWRFCRVTSWLGLAPRAWQTPYEYSQVLSQLVPERATPLRHLTELFVRDRWGQPQTFHEYESEQVENLWPSLRLLFLRLFLRRSKK